MEKLTALQEKFYNILVEESKVQGNMVRITDGEIIRKYGLFKDRVNPNSNFTSLRRVLQHKGYISIGVNEDGRRMYTLPLLPNKRTFTIGINTRLSLVEKKIFINSFFNIGNTLNDIEYSTLLKFLAYDITKTKDILNEINNIENLSPIIEKLINEKYLLCDGNKIMINYSINRELQLSLIRRLINNENFKKKYKDILN